VKADAAGYVLVGGRSSRFGADKALASWRGRPLASHVAGQVERAAGSVVLIGDPEKYSPLGFPAIADAAPGLGPLGGIATALEHSTAPWNLVVACDMPHLSAAFLAFLLETAGARAADVLLPLDADSRDEPLCAVYSLASRALIVEALRGGVRKVTHAFDGLRVERLARAGYAAFDPDGLLFANLNTAADAAALEVHG